MTGKRSIDPTRASSRFFSDASSEAPVQGPALECSAARAIRYIGQRLADEPDQGRVFTAKPLKQRNFLRESLHDICVTPPRAQHKGCPRQISMRKMLKFPHSHMNATIQPPLEHYPGPVRA